MAQSVADILGCPLDMATGLFEAAGGNVELAIELGLGGGGGDDTGGGAFGGAPPAAAATSSGGFQSRYENYTKIWPEAEPIPDSWKNQRLNSFMEEDTANATNPIWGIIQPANGPCGVLSVVQAELWIIMQQQTKSSPPLNKEEALTKAIANILSRIVAAKKIGNDLVTLADGSTKSVDDASKSIRTASELVEVAALTYLGDDDSTRSTSILSSLVEGRNWLCSSDLMCLLFTGTIQSSGSFGAYNAITKQKTTFYEPSSGSSSRIGILSMMEIDEKIPVADDLKFVDSDVWILHTGDHFVTMRRRRNPNDETSLSFEVYDGLQPNGPITKLFELSGIINVADKAPDTHTETFRKKRVGQSDDIVQANKKPSDAATASPNYKEWLFEVVPAIDDPDVQGPYDEDPDEPVYDYQTLEVPTNNWRCATCYSNRFKTMNFGLNESSTSEKCPSCNTPIRQAMWSLWLPFQDLSPRMKKRARNMYASKAELTISTLYPFADIVEE